MIDFTLGFLFGCLLAYVARRAFLHWQQPPMPPPGPGKYAGQPPPGGERDLER